LYSLGLIDPSEFTSEKLVNSNAKNIKTLVLILCDLNNLLYTKHNSQQQPANVDDILSSSYEFIESGCNQFQQQPTTNTSYFDELFSKKIQIFDDNNFMKEFRTITVQVPNSYLPQDVSRVIKNINENSTYLISHQNTQPLLKEELVALLEKELMNLKDQIKTYQKPICDV